ncbi:hypothetical protein L6452_37213 [Arctium lappa]|uniref:Uncharacterized protein n=1 Tax=Arctium lappa TaxID=4217 RepID=A0ACB8Y6I5_ARCLA|nr:hypothetical protein L6452_37213 [Arctium lappa]
MDNLDLEDIPPDLREIFLPNLKTVSEPIDSNSDCLIGSAYGCDGVNLPQKTKGVKVKKEKSIKELLLSSLGFNVASPISTAIRKQIPSRISKKKGSISGDKKINAAIDLVELDLLNKKDRSSGLLCYEKKMAMEADNSPSEKSDLNFDSKLSNIVMTDSHVNATNINGNVKARSDPEVLLNAVSNNMSGHVNLNIGQRPKSNLTVANDNNRDNSNKAGLVSPGNDSFGSGGGSNGRGGDVGGRGSGSSEGRGHYFTFGGGKGVNNTTFPMNTGVNSKTSVNVPDVVMTDDSVKEPQVNNGKANNPVNQNGNVWNSKGITLADKIKGNSEIKNSEQKVWKAKPKKDAKSGQKLTNSDLGNEQKGQKFGSGDKSVKFSFGGQQNVINNGGFVNGNKGQQSGVKTDGSDSNSKGQQSVMKNDDSGNKNKGQQSGVIFVGSGSNSKRQ